MEEKEIEKRTQWFKEELKKTGMSQKEIEETVNAPATQDALRTEGDYYKMWLEMVTM